MPDDPQNPDSLGDDRTFVGEGDSPPEEEQSLGDEDTHVVGMASFLSDLELGFATASAVIGCIIGPFLGSFLADRIGRKNTMLIACLLLAISAFFTAIPESIFVFNIFRIIGGIGVGLCSMASNP